MKNNRCPKCGKGLEFNELEAFCPIFLACGFRISLVKMQEIINDKANWFVPREEDDLNDFNEP